MVTNKERLLKIKALNDYFKLLDLNKLTDEELDLFITTLYDIGWAKAEAFQVDPGRFELIIYSYLEGDHDLLPKEIQVIQASEEDLLKNQVYFHLSSSVITK